jgi:hypothetical protein
MVGQPPDFVSELGGGQSGQSAPPVSGPGAVPVPPTEGGLLPVDGPGQGPPPGQTAPPRPGPIQTPEDIPAAFNPDDLVALFTKQHGRAPGAAEKRDIRATAILSRQLGRRPSKRELMQYVYGRSENQPNAQPQVVVDGEPSVQSAPIGQ